MLKKTAAKAITAAFVSLLFVTMSLMAQGIADQEYTGLDKYPTQGRPDQSSFVGVRAAEFLTIPVGARGIALGSSYSAIADDITSIWWNPAGLGFLERNEVMFTVVDYTLDLTYSYGALAMPVADGQVVIGGFFGYLDIPDMEITTFNSPGGTGRSFNAYDFQMGGSVAYNFSDRFTSGINMKFIHQDVFNNVSGNAFAIDAGAIYHTQLMDREFKFAFSMQNLGTNITMRGSNLIREVGPENRSGLIPDGYGDYSVNSYAMSRRAARNVMYLTHTYRLPTVVKVAAAYNLYTGDKANLLASAELWRNSNIPLSYATGSELSYNFSLDLSAALRLGWKIQTDEYTKGSDDFGYDYLGDDPTFRGFSIGGGFKRNFAGKTLSFDYAYRNKGRLSADNFFTVSFGF